MHEVPFAAGQLVVAEMFGPTVQGEGPSLGMKCTFLRVGQCNLTCVWCDTAYTWDWERYNEREEVSSRSIEDVATALEEIGIPMLVVSGGEPLIQQRSLEQLFRLLPQTPRIEIETNGTIKPSAALTRRVTQFNVSPKLSNSHVPLSRRFRSSSLRALQETGKAIFKFVITGPRDFEEADEIVREAGLSNVYVMAEGTSAAQIIERSRELVAPTMARGWTLTTRLHVLLYGNQRAI